MIVIPLSSTIQACSWTDFHISSWKIKVCKSFEWNDSFGPFVSSNWTYFRSVSKTRIGLWQENKHCSLRILKRMSRLRKIGNESKKLQIANRDMEKRLNEIKALFEKEQGEFILSLSSDNTMWQKCSSKTGKRSPYLGQ